MRTIDLESLKIFRTVVDEGGVVRAADKLNRVQSNVTTRIRQLEQHVGARLFRREGRSHPCCRRRDTRCSSMRTACCAWPTRP